MCVCHITVQAQPIQADLVNKVAGSRVSVSPIVTVEPRRRKFHKPITLTIPVPKSQDPNSSLRLLCSITGELSDNFITTFSLLLYLITSFINVSFKIF